MKQTLMMESNPAAGLDAQKLEMARRLLDLLNAHIMSDEGVRRTSFQELSRN